MRNSSILSEKKFWFVVDYILEKVSEINLNHLLEELQLSRDQFNCFFTFFKDLGVEVDLTENIFKIDVNKEFNLKMSLSQWLKFQAHFPALECLKDEPFHEEVAFILGNLERENKHFDLFESISNLEEIMPREDSLQLVNHNLILEAVIVSKESIQIKIGESLFDILAHRLLNLCGVLNLVYENLNSHTLHLVDLSDVRDIQHNMSHKKSVFSDFEVQSFIKNIRELESKEERLILKIINESKFHENIKNEFFRNRVIVKNHNNQKIWSASVELNDEIFSWILSINSSIEILSSDEFKKNYLDFCQRHLKKLA